MRSTFVPRPRPRRLTATALAALAGFVFPAGASAEPKSVSLKDIAAWSELIVVATVTKIEDGPPDLPRFPSGTAKLATARVVETWKGQPVREVRYIASPTWGCDISRAEKGELVVLFLEKSRDGPFLAIFHGGRGRMPVHEVKTKRYAELQEDVFLPERTPTVSEKREAPGPPPFLYEVVSVEMGALKAMVKASGR